MESSPNTQTGSRRKYLIGGLIILSAVVYLIYSSTKATGEYFLSVDELAAQNDSMVGRNLRVSGAVIGSSIQFTPENQTLAFDIANVPNDNATIEAQGGLAKVLHDAVVDPSRRHLSVVYNGPKPDLMRDEAQAIITGHLGPDGVFQADELLLKCPTKYEQAVPSQVNQK
jgi:cytochrome c-type biogenesis protein CcmE